MAVKLDRLPFQSTNPVEWGDKWGIFTDEQQGKNSFKPPQIIRKPLYKVISRHTDIPGVPYRYYLVEGPDGSKFTAPSVTSYIGAGSNIEFGLKKWRKNIGEDYAELISNMTPYLGDVYHRSLDWALSGRMTLEMAQQHVAWPWFEDVAYVIGTELPVVSRRLGVCGTLDLLYVNHKGEVVLVDNKTIHRRYPVEQEKDETLSHTLDRTLEGQTSKLTKYRKQIVMYDLGVEETYQLRVHHHRIWGFSTTTFTRETIDLFKTKAGYTRAITAAFDCREKFMKCYGFK
jgi:hypothetical protein